MSWKSMSQPGLSDAFMIEHEAINKLDAVHEIIDWEEIKAVLSSIHNKKEGNSAYPPVMMFKIRLLQSWYNLSDPGTEAQLARDLLFKRFVGLSMHDKVPDHSTIWRFRDQMTRKQLLKPLFTELNHQLSKQGLYIQSGAVNIVDATVIEAHQSRPRKNPQGQSTQDQEAGYNIKTNAQGHRRTTYGYKGHINIDEDGFIQALDYSSGNHHDSLFLKNLVSDNQGKVYADSAYKSKKHDCLLGARNCIHERAYRGKPLTSSQKKRNRLRSKIRASVEGVFGQLKLHQGLGKARYLGKARNEARFMLIVMSHNLKKGLSIYQQCMSLQDECA